jgi:polysaccharide pyruvyl transferase WcaK-like protein
LKDNICIHKNTSMTKPLVAYHRTMSTYGLEIMKSATILGQDFLDEVVFTNNRNNDNLLYEQEMSKYQQVHDYKKVLETINRNGIFPNRYKLWFDIIGAHDFVIGARLHGCIAALIQGIPALLVPRDLRMMEMAEFYNIPTVSIEELQNKSIQQLYEDVDFSDFKRMHKDRYKNYYEFLQKNKLIHKLERPTHHEFDNFEVSIEKSSIKEVSLKLTFNLS